jgi:hypothetical protein
LLYDSDIYYALAGCFDAFVKWFAGLARIVLFTAMAGLVDLDAVMRRMYGLTRPGIEATYSNWYCKYCTAKIDSASRFCCYCGQNLQWLLISLKGRVDQARGATQKLRRIEMPKLVGAPA